MTLNKKASTATKIPDNLSSDDSINKLSDSVTKMIVSFFGSQSAGGHFLSFWLINFIVYISTLGAVFQFIPSDLEWLNKLIFLGCVITSFLASAYSISAHKNQDRYFQTPLAILDSVRITVMGVAIMVVLYVVWFFLAPPRYVTPTQLSETVSDLRNEFTTLGLNEKQINQVFMLLKEGNYVTKDDLPEGLTEQQRTEIMGIINSSIRTFAATLTALPKTSCYLTLVDTAESVYIRDKADKTNSKIVDYLDMNDVALVLGHDGYPNDGWWYIQITHRGKTTEGWIATKWVKLQSLENCAQVKQIATPFP